MRTLIILVLVGLILGGSAYFAYELYWKPRKLDREDKATAAQAEIPDYTLPAYQKAVDLEKTGDIEGARTALEEFIRDFPTAPKVAEAKATLGRINTDLVFSPKPSADKVTYSVGKGDSLVKIASRFKTNAELIFRANNMETINLRIGQTLVVPKLDISMVVDRHAHTVTLFDKGRFFKEYRTISLKTPGVSSSAKTKVADKIALQGSNRVAFGEKNYSGSERWVMLGSAGLVIRSVPEGTEPLPPGIIVAPADIEEIFLLVSRGSPVTIQ